MARLLKELAVCLLRSGKEQFETDHNKTPSEKIHNMAARFQREGRAPAAGGPREGFWEEVGAQ